MKVRDPKPEILRLEELVTSIRQGEIRLPKFQRPFVWQKTDIINLFDSIYNGYPIGSILLWHSNERLKSEREIIGFKLTQNNFDNYPTEYLLDGQQRLTSLCATLYWDGEDEKSIWNIFFNLDTETFVYSKENRVTLFPMNKLLSTGDFIKQCMKFQTTNNSEYYNKRAERLLKAFKDYKIAVVKIGDVSLEEVAPIFERINSTGRKLTVVDLMRAATWKNGFDLTESISKIKEQYIRKFGEISDSQILRMLSTSVGLGINKSDIDKLRDENANSLNHAVVVTTEALKKTISFLNQYVGLKHVSYIPYGMQLNLLVEYFRLSNIDKNLPLLEQWFWRTSVTKYFGGASTGQLAKDLKEIRDFACGDKDNFEYGEYIFNTQELFYDEFNLRTASSRTFALILKKEFENKTKRIIDSINVELFRDYYFDIASVTGKYYGMNINKIFIPTYLDDKQFNLIEQLLASSNFVDDSVNIMIPQAESDIILEKRISIMNSYIQNLAGIR